MATLQFSHLSTQGEKGNEQTHPAMGRRAPDRRARRRCRSRRVAGDIVVGTPHEPPRNARRRRVPPASPAAARRSSSSSIRTSSSLRKPRRSTGRARRVRSRGRRAQQGAEGVERHVAADRHDPLYADSPDYAGTDPVLTRGPEPARLAQALRPHHRVRVRPVARPDRIFAAPATGGVWESTDGGANWRSIGDDAPDAGDGRPRLLDRERRHAHRGHRRQRRRRHLHADRPRRLHEHATTARRGRRRPASPTG